MTTLYSIKSSLIPGCLRTKWIVSGFNKQHHEPALHFMQQFLGQYNLSKLSYVRFSTVSPHGILYGFCHYPRSKKYRVAKCHIFYRISCFVPGPFPWHVRRQPTPDQRTIVDLLFKFQRRAKLGLDLDDFTPRTLINNRSEAMVWIFGHEVFHFLRHSRQIPGRNLECHADAFGDETLAAYRSWLQ